MAGGRGGGAGGGGGRQTGPIFCKKSQENPEENFLGDFLRKILGISRIFVGNSLGFFHKNVKKRAAKKVNFCGGRSNPPGEGLDEEIGSGLRVATLHHPLSASPEGGMVQRRPPRFARRPRHAR